MKWFYPLLIALFFVNGALSQWVPQNSGTTQNLNAVYFTDANKGFVVGNNGTILKTTNGGTEWISQTPGTALTLNSVTFINENAGYTVGDSCLILKTINGGVLWEIQSSAVTGNLKSVCFINPDTGYAVGSDIFGEWNFILKTTDGGNLWLINYIDTTTWAVHLNSVTFFDANTGYAAGRIVDNGGGTAGTVLKTINAGSSWIPFSGYLPAIFSIYFTGAYVGYAAGHEYFGFLYERGGNLLKTTDGGSTWTSQMSIGDSSLTAIYFPNTDTGYAVGGSWTWGGLSENGIILKTINGGTNWTFQTADVSKVLNAVYFVDGNTGYAVGNGGTILKTTNGGGYVGIQDHHQITNILSISPNPSSTSITIGSSTKGLITILNYQGKQLLHNEFTGSNQTIDISGFASGVYFVKVIGEKEIRVGKFIKQ